MELFEVTGSWCVALGKTLVHSLWIGLLILAVLKFMLLRLPIRNSSMRYHMATVSLLLFLGMTAAMFVMLFDPWDSQAESLSRMISINALFGSSQGTVSPPERPPMVVFFHICSFAYLLGILVMSIRSVLSFSHIQHLKRSGIPVQGEWHERFLRIRDQLGIRKNVCLLESERISIPALVGLLKPAILVPAGMFTQLPTGQVETILLHELYHLRRLDFVVNTVQLVVETLFFYNPAVWSISRMIRAERENCCDDLVIGSCGDPLLYARALFQLAGYHQPLHKLLPSAGGSDQYQLFNRIKRILNQRDMKTDIREKLISLLIIAGAVLVLFTVSGFSTGLPSMRLNNTNPEKESITLPAEPEQISAVEQDTVPEIDTEALKKELETAKKEAIAAIDWEALKKELEAAKEEAIASIDWESLKKEMEEARKEAMESVDWEKIEQDIAHSKIHLDSMLHNFEFDFDFDHDFHFDVEEALKEIENIDWESIKNEVERSMQEIDWEAIHREMEKARIHLDSLMHDIHQQ